MLDCGPVEYYIYSREHQARQSLPQVFEWAELAAADVSAAVRSGPRQARLPPVGQQANMQHATCIAVAEACMLCTARTERTRGYALGKHSEATGH